MPNARTFAATLRSSNDELRARPTDEGKLSKLGLPVWNTEADLAEALGLSVKELRFFSIHRQAPRIAHYVTFAVAKRSGGERLILAPKRRLKAIQRKLLNEVVNKLPLSPFAHGFRRKHSIRTAAEPHVGKDVVLRMDIQDFFPSVTFPRVRGLFASLGYAFPVATILAVLATEAERQPVKIEEAIYHVPIGQRHCVQGAPTSPGICNCLASRMDYRLAGLAKKFDYAYTRYADDLTFSGPSKGLQTLRGYAIRIIRDEGFQVRADKTHVARRGCRQRVLGVVVNEKLGLSRKERRRLRAAIHQSQHSDAKKEPPARIRGRLAYLSMLNPEQAEVLGSPLKGVFKW